MSKKFRYASIGLLFVNISIGGTMTHFAAPPVLMVAAPWNWDTPFMMTHFGWKAAIACIVGAILTTIIFAKELKQNQKMQVKEEKVTFNKPPVWIIAGHIIFMAVTIMHSHHMSFFVPLFLFFVGWCTVTNEYQEELKIKESLLVAFFLGGLVTLGGLQSWWIRPLLTSLGDLPLFFGATALTAVTDNAALTYLGTLVPDLSDSAKYALVAGAVTGGGLTVIANAPNPAGYSILSSTFGEEGISPIGLFLGALPYTLIAIIAFLALPNI
jgi:Na+/H+ antiporter NhaD/arsenite permease-like protein